MRFALVNALRQEAQPGLSGKCPSCDRSLVAKCGELRIWHWAHQGNRSCDPWWENEGEWHRAWKSQFPEAWQEVVHRADDGTKHIADIKTERGWSIEFQHSSLKPEERRSRDAFYPQLIWVVDGTRRKRDLAQFANAWRDGSAVGQAQFVRRVRPEECALVREWAQSPWPIFLDFGHAQALWWMLPGRPDGWVYIAQFSRADFIASHHSDAAQLGADFDQLVRDLGGLVASYEKQQRMRVVTTLYRDPLRMVRRGRRL